MSDVAIRVENLGKKFLIGHQKSGDLRNTISNKLSTLLGQSNNSIEEYWALQNLSFEIKQGEAVGIIGRNGAGKSTLLKILSRITDPSTGRFEINGRVSSLLEVGTGFHMELTGRENIYLNGTILGMRRHEIKSKFDQIVEFSGVEKFLDTPVKHYSSGMKVRLAFSVAAHLEPEILIIDEVLAVGDAEFQKKCLGKMDEVSKQEGRTILFVSHNLSAVSHLCNEGFLLNNGSIEIQGNIEKVVDYYSTQFLARSRSNFSDKVKMSPSDDFLITDMVLTDKNNVVQSDFVCGSEVNVRLKYHKRDQNVTGDLAIGLLFYDQQNQFLTVLNNKIAGQNLSITENCGEIICTIPKLPLMFGEYVISLRVKFQGMNKQRIDDAAVINVIEGDYYSSGFPNAMGRQGVYINHKWRVSEIAN